MLHGYRRLRKGPGEKREKGRESGISSKNSKFPFGVRGKLWDFTLCLLHILLCVSNKVSSYNRKCALSCVCILAGFHLVSIMLADKSGNPVNS